MTNLLNRINQFLDEQTTTADVAKYHKRIGSKKKSDEVAINFVIKNEKATERLKKLKKDYEDRGVTVVFNLKSMEGEARVPSHLVNEIQQELENIKGIEI